MAEFTPSKKTAQDFNEGVEYIDGQGNETGDALQAETINNLVESALYTQEQAGNAKQIAEDALSQVELVIKDRTLLSVVRKNLYNLGKYDTVVSNGNGTATITRKTGYIFSSDISSIYVSFKHYAHIVLKGAVYYNNQFSLISNLYPTAKNSNFDGTDRGVYFYDNLRVVIKAVNPNEEKTEQEWNDYLKSNNFCVQYELATARTEEVIENHPIHTLDQSGEERIRDEWKEGLNYCPIKELPTGIQGKIIVNLNAGVYTMSLNLDGTGGNYEVRDENNVLLAGGPVRSTLKFNVSQKQNIGIHFNPITGTTSCMINKGSVIYPYTPYRGQIVRSGEIAPVATSGNYNDLTEKPVIPSLYAHYFNGGYVIIGDVVVDFSFIIYDNISTNLTNEQILSTLPTSGTLFNSKGIPVTGYFRRDNVFYQNIRMYKRGSDLLVYGTNHENGNETGTFATISNIDLSSENYQETIKIF